ncbi:hypothetical protein J2755_000256 [Methanohalophilus levihalophilus]|uniref:hypothetical protein n=1 Tax=Methanohalophilus levihalophilus TaxID=1431282 RepID=UPI001AEAE0DB|nr:hypothetical protein [Methanohalophilus levihalophilus]MBP2029336.1 hypothetical protein [Methanohalophilus levihalophilus]
MREIETEELVFGSKSNNNVKYIRKHKTGYNIRLEAIQNYDAEELEVYRFLIGGLAGK